MLIESFIPNPDAVETHKIEIAASREVVYQALWTTDLGGSSIIKSLMALRSLPGIVSHPKRLRRVPKQITQLALQLAGWLLAVEVVGVLVEFVGRDYLRLGSVEPLTAAGVLLRTLLGALLIWVLPNVLLFYKWRGLFAKAKKPGL